MSIHTENNHRGVDTSIAAAAKASLGASYLRRVVLRVLREHPENLTVDQTCAIAERPRYSLQPRFTELRDMGLIRDTGERRLNKSGATAKVWRAVALDKQGTRHD